MSDAESKIKTEREIRRPASLTFTGERYVPGEASRWMRDAHEERYRFASNFAQNRRILEIACGSGYGTDALCQAGASLVHAVDIDSATLEYANSQNQSEIITFRQGCMETFTSRITYDLVVSFETIEHVDNYFSGLKNLFKLMADDGVLLISSPNRALSSPSSKLIIDTPDNPFHVREFTPSELIAVLELCGFSVDAGEVYGQGSQFNFLLPLLNKVVRKLITRTFASLKVRPLPSYRQSSYFLIVARKKSGKA